MSSRLSVAAAGCAGPLSLVMPAFTLFVDVICAESDTDEITTTAVFKKMRQAKDLQRLYLINLLEMLAPDSGNAIETGANTPI
jgi:hypothetical protein